MTPTEMLARFVVGGALITIVSLVGRTGYSILSGLIVLFPIVTLVGYYFLSFDVSNETLKDVTLFSIISVPTVWGFTIGFYFSLGYMSVEMALLVGILSWVVVAIAVIFIDYKFLELVVANNV